MTGSWFRRFGRTDRTDNAGVRLLCFPYAGGSASYYHRLCKALRPSGIEVVAVQYPGRQDRHQEPVIDDLDRLADEIAGALDLEASEPDGQFAGGSLACFGHSMGAIVAFEVLCRVGIRPVAFVASGRKAPSRSVDPPAELLDDDGVLAKVDRLGAADRRLLDRPDVRKMLMPVLRGDYRAIETYRYRPRPPLRCPLIVLGGTDDPMTTIDDLEAWRVHVTGHAFVRHAFAGDHFFLDDHLADIAGIIHHSVSSGVENG